MHPDLIDTAASKIAPNGIPTAETENQSAQKKSTLCNTATKGSRVTSNVMTLTLQNTRVCNQEFSQVFKTLNNEPSMRDPKHRNVQTAVNALALKGVRPMRSNPGIISYFFATVQRRRRVEWYTQGVERRYRRFVQGESIV